MTPQEQLDGFFDKFAPDVAATIRRAVAMVSAGLHGATVLVYDNYTALAIAFGASAALPIDQASRGRLVIRSISAKQRPGRP